MFVFVCFADVCKPVVWFWVVIVLALILFGNDGWISNRSCANYISQLFFMQTGSRYIQHSALFVLNWWCHLHFESHSICHSMAYMIIQQTYILVFQLIILSYFFFKFLTRPLTKSNLACMVIFGEKNILRKTMKTFYSVKLMINYLQMCDSRNWWLCS